MRTLPECNRDGCRVHSLRWTIRQQIIDKRFLRLMCGVDRDSAGTLERLHYLVSRNA